MAASFSHSLALKERNVAVPPNRGQERFQVVVGSRSELRDVAWPALVVALVLLVVAVIAPLVLNTQMAQRSYDIRDQQVVLNELQARKSTLEAELRSASSPNALRKKAAEAGLVPAGKLGAVSLEDKTVEGGERAK